MTNFEKKIGTLLQQVGLVIFLVTEITISMKPLKIVGSAFSTLVLDFWPQSIYIKCAIMDSIIDTTTVYCEAEANPSLPRTARTIIAHHLQSSTIIASHC